MRPNPQKKYTLLPSDFDPHLLEKWERTQNELLAALAQDQTPAFELKTGTRCAALDVQYQGDKAFCALAFWEHLGAEGPIFESVQTVTEPYYPRFFAFREGPVLQAHIQAYLDSGGQMPEVLLVDGHGQAHPLRLGVATWLGLKLECVTVGCAKDSLLNYEGELNETAGSTLSIYLDNQEVGRALRSANKVKPIFVSVGRGLNLDQACDLVWAARSPYRIPEPLRRADAAVRLAAKKDSEN